MPDAPFMTRPWPEIAAFYRDFSQPSCQAVADLCEYIAARAIRSGLHGWTSMRQLGIVQRPVTYPYDGPYLRIEPFVTRSDDHDVEFRMIDTHVSERQWSRRETAGRVIERFKQTMRQLNWFTDPAGLD